MAALATTTTASINDDGIIKKAPLNLPIATPAAATATMPIAMAAIVPASMAHPTPSLPVHATATPATAISPQYQQAVVAAATLSSQQQQQPVEYLRAACIRCRSSLRYPSYVTLVRCPVCVTITPRDQLMGAATTPPSASGDQSLRNQCEQWTTTQVCVFLKVSHRTSLLHVTHLALFIIQVLIL
jgi:LSD1 subclass zinc finger protein